MTGKETIKHIETTLGITLKQVELEDIAKKDFFTVNPFRYVLSYRESPSFPYKGSRNYSLDTEGNITGLSLDFCNVSLLKNIGTIFQKPDLIQFLSFHSSYIEDYSGLKNFTNLTSLSLSDNNISDISFLKGLTNLTSLDLRNNNISEIPLWLARLGLRIKIDDEYASDCINLFKNEITTPPVEIVKQGNGAIINYYKQIEEQGGTEILYEAKVLIVGEGGAGKTTLLKKLENPELLLPDTKSTLGVEVKEGLTFNHPSDDKIKIFANLWDFGGQVIQYQLHQYFLTSDSLYILVANNRDQKTRWDYWFQIIRLLGGNCPVLVVINNNQTISTVSDFNKEKCKNNFSELDIDDVQIDFNINNFKWEYLQKKIINTISELPLVNKPVPRLWKALREKIRIEKQSNKYVKIQRYIDICAEIDLKREEDCLQALDYFDKIGIVKHFSQDDNLRDIVFLEPNWITQGLYAVLDKENTEIDNGCFTYNWIDNYWARHTNSYSIEERTYLLRLMLKDNFDICYPIGDEKYIVPMLLTDSKPNYEWEIESNLHFRFQYPFMPEGIISRLIVRLYDYIEDNLVWREGAVFFDKKSNCKAEVRQLKNVDTGLKYIRIRVEGDILDNRKDFLGKIIDQVEYIHHIKKCVALKWLYVTVKNVII